MAATFEESLMANMTARREELRAALHQTYEEQYAVECGEIEDELFSPRPTEAEIDAMAEENWEDHHRGIPTWEPVSNDPTDSWPRPVRRDGRPSEEEMAREYAAFTSGEVGLE